MKKPLFLTFILTLVTPVILLGSASALNLPFSRQAFRADGSTFAASCSGGVSSAKSCACVGVGELGGPGCSSKGLSLKTLIKTIVEILSLVLGGIAIIMIIISGIRFATSGGGQNGVAAAKNTLIYAIVGLVLAFLAQAIIHWVLNTTSQVVGLIHF